MARMTHTMALTTSNSASIVSAIIPRSGASAAAPLTAQSRQAETQAATSLRGCVVDERDQLCPLALATDEGDARRLLGHG